jgi:hypothetical protein
MRRFGNPERGLLVLAAALAALSLGVTTAAAQPDDVLPDLNQMVPRDLSVKAKKLGGRTVYRLGFASAAANVGDGPLTLHGYRPDASVPTMRVDQLVEQLEGPSRLVRDVGTMSYVVHPDHKHWHLLDFERYELWSRHATHLVARDRKTGFCLGDRFAIWGAEGLRGFSPTPLQGDTCGLGQPGLTSLFAGISVGWADRYGAQLEGQYIDVTNVPSGVYVLVHRVNLDGALAESGYGNNASSVRFRLAWRNSRSLPPRVKILRRCPGSAACSPRADGAGAP